MKSSFSDLHRFTRRIADINWWILLFTSAIFMMLLIITIKYRYAAFFITQFYSAMIMYIIFQCINGNEISLSDFDEERFKIIFKIFLRFMVVNVSAYIIFKIGVFLLIIGLSVIVSMPYFYFMDSYWTAIVLIILTAIFALYLKVKLSMVFPLLIDESSTTVANGIVKGSNLIKGHIFNYILYIMSYIGWVFLLGITLGLSAVYVAPLLIIADISYYLMLTNNPIFKKCIKYNQKLYGRR